MVITRSLKMSNIYLNSFQQLVTCHSWHTIIGDDHIHLQILLKEIPMNNK